MIHLLSWRGRGYIALFAIIAAVMIGIAAGAWSEHWLLLGMSVGWLFAGAICWTLGRRWNAEAVRHVFCGMRLQRWAFVFGFFGLLLLPVAINAIRYKL